MIRPIHRAPSAGRRKAMLRAASLIVIAVALATPAAAQCMKDNEPGQTAEGRLTIGSARDAAGRPQQPYILRLPAARCLDALDPEDNVKSTRTVHVYPADDKLVRAFKRLVGKSVQVRGRPFA